MDILSKQEAVRVEGLLGHGGLFKTERVAQQLMAAALHAPVGVMATAGEGGAWGIALLADYMARKQAGDSLGGYLLQHVFRHIPQSLIEPVPDDVEGFEAYLKVYQKGLAIERAATETLS
jgi:sugar (pentulose or hexulose) kinase